MSFFRPGLARLVLKQSPSCLLSRGFSSASHSPLELLPKFPSRDGLKKDEDLDPIYKDPVKIIPKHGVVSCNIHFRGYAPWTIDFYMEFVRHVAYAAEVSCSGPVSLPTKVERWAVPKSPFIFKKCQEVFERKTHKRLLQLKDVHPKTLKHFINYLQENSPPGVGIRIETYQHEDVDQVIRSLEKVELANVTPKPKILADAIVAEVAKNPSSNLIEVGTRLYKQIFNIKELPSLDFIKKPKAKTLRKREAEALAKKK